MQSRKPYNSTIGLNESQQTELAQKLGLSSASTFLSETKTTHPSRHEQVLSLEEQALEKLKGKRPFE